MRRVAALLLSVGLVAAAVPAAHAARIKTKQPRSRTFYVVANAGACALSTDPGRGDAQASCAPDGLERFTTALGTAPIEMASLDGLPFSLDTTQPVRVELLLRSAAVIGYEGPLGAGAAELHVKLTATARGAEVVIGEATESYTVTPSSLDYPVRLDVAVDPSVAGVPLDALTMHVNVTGPTVNHGYVAADGSSRVTFSLAR